MSSLGTSKGCLQHLEDVSSGGSKPLRSRGLWRGRKPWLPWHGTFSSTAPSPGGQLQRACPPVPLGRAQPPQNAFYRDSPSSTELRGLAPSASIGEVHGSHPGTEKQASAVLWFHTVGSSPDSPFLIHLPSVGHSAARSHGFYLREPARERERAAGKGRGRGGSRLPGAQSQDSEDHDPRRPGAPHNPQFLLGHMILQNEPQDPAFPTARGLPLPPSSCLCLLPNPWHRTSVKCS